MSRTLDNARKVFSMSPAQSMGSTDTQYDDDDGSDSVINGVRQIPVSSLQPNDVVEWGRDLDTEGSEFQ